MKWDEAIELQEKYVAKLEEKYNNSIKKLLLPKKHWKIVKVKDIFRITRGQVLPISKCNDEYSYPVYSSQTANDGLMGFYDQYLFEDCITWTTDGANAGNVNFRKGKFYCTNVCGVLINNNGYSNACIANIINKVTKKYVSYIGNPKLMNNTMSIIPITIPPLEEQIAISKYIDLSFEFIKVQKSKVNKLKRKRKALQQYLLNGIVRVF